MRIGMVLNTGSADVLERLREAVTSLRDAGHEVTPRLTFEAGDARLFARQAGDAGVELLVVGGGDGTVNEAINGLCDAAGDGVPLPRLAIVPLGTGNDLANAMGIPLDPETAVASALAGQETPIDVATVNGRRFLNVSTGGFGAAATEETPDEAKRFLGGLAYLVTGAKKLVEKTHSVARFTADGRTVHEGSFLAYAVGNSRRTGGGTLITPRAELDDGLLDLCIVGEISTVDLVALLPRLRAGRHVGHPAVKYLRVKEVVVEPEERLAVNADGEHVEGERFVYGIEPRRATLMLPGPLPRAPEERDEAEELDQAETEGFAGDVAVLRLDPHAGEAPADGAPSTDGGMADRARGEQARDGAPSA